MWSMRESIRSTVISTLTINNLVLQANEPCEYLQLPCRMQPLFSELDQAFVISNNVKLGRAASNFAIDQQP
jgi:hypothetical protein